MTDIYKLRYFPLNARGMISRAILYYSNAKFEDIRIKFEEWPKIKTSGICEYGQVPILEFNGKFYSQSHAIEHYLGRIFNLYGKNIDEEYQIDSLIDSFDDLFAPYHSIGWPKTEEEKKNIEENKKKFATKFEFFVSVYDRHYERNGYKKYFIGDSFTVADIYITCVLTYYSDLFKCENKIKEIAPKLFKLIVEIKSKELKTYFDKGYIPNSN